MWVVAKIKSNEIDIFKKELEKRLETKPLFYNPKIQVEKNQKTKIKKYSKSILENYIFCYHKSFNNIKFIQHLKNVKGLSFFLNGYNLNQKEETLKKFIQNALKMVVEPIRNGNLKQLPSRQKPRAEEEEVGLEHQEQLLGLNKLCLLIQRIYQC